MRERPDTPDHQTTRGQILNCFSSRKGLGVFRLANQGNVDVRTDGLRRRLSTISNGRWTEGDVCPRGTKGDVFNSSTRASLCISPTSTDLCLILTVTFIFVFKKVVSYLAVGES